MKMVMTIVPKKYAEETLSAIINAGFTATFYETRGGMLRQSQTTMFSAIKDDDLSKFLRIIDEIDNNPQPRTVGAQSPRITSNGTVVFAWTLDNLSDIG